MPPGVGGGTGGLYPPAAGTVSGRRTGGTGLVAVDGVHSEPGFIEVLPGGDFRLHPVVCLICILTRFGLQELQPADVDRDLALGAHANQTFLRFDVAEPGNAGSLVRTR